MARRRRGVNGGSAWASMLALAACRCAAGAPADAPVAAPSVVMQPEVVLTQPPTGGGADAVHGVSGLRFWGGALWLVLDWPAAGLARVDACRDTGGRMRVSAVVMQRIEQPLGTASSARCARGLQDAEALVFAADGSLVIATDEGQVGRLSRVDDSDTWRLTECRQYGRADGWGNKAFEALLLFDDAPWPIEERTYARASRAGDKLQVHWPPPPSCGGAQLRITDAVQTIRGAVLLASCRRAVGRYRYFLGRLDPGGLPRVNTAVELLNPRMRNLEGLDVGPDGLLYVANDDSDGGNPVRAPSELWSLKLDASARATLGLGDIAHGQLLQACPSPGGG